MVSLAGFEPTASRLGIMRSIQLSYKDTKNQKPEESELRSTTHFKDKESVYFFLLDLVVLPLFFSCTTISLKTLPGLNLGTILSSVA